MADSLKQLLGHGRIRHLLRWLFQTVYHTLIPAHALAADHDGMAADVDAQNPMLSYSEKAMKFEHTSKPPLLTLSKDMSLSVQSEICTFKCLL